MKTFLKMALIGVCIAAFLGCGAYLSPTLVKDLPTKNYEKIIYLRTENPTALYPTLGLIYVLPGKSVTTTYPYKRELKSENELTREEKLNFPSMKIMELKNKAGEVEGYIRILGPVVVDAWQQDGSIMIGLDMTKTLGDHPEPTFFPGQGGGGGGAQN